MKFKGEYKFEEWLRLFPSIGNGNTIPPITNSLGKHWTQAERSSIVFIDSKKFDKFYNLENLKDSRIPKHDYVALMTQQSFDLIPSYDTSTPTGAYAGKMWKTNLKGGPTILCWFGYHHTEDFCSNHYAPIMVVSLEKLKQEQIKQNYWVTRQTVE